MIYRFYICQAHRKVVATHHPVNQTGLPRPSPPRVSFCTTTCILRIMRLFIFFWGGGGGVGGERSYVTWTLLTQSSSCRLVNPYVSWRLTAFDSGTLSLKFFVVVKKSLLKNVLRIVSENIDNSQLDFSHFFKLLTVHINPRSFCRILISSSFVWREISFCRNSSNSPNAIYLPWKLSNLPIARTEIPFSCINFTRSKTAILLPISRTNFRLARTLEKSQFHCNYIVKQK